MSNLLTSLANSAGALDVYDKVLALTQNNVANASTPGYAKQRLTLEALPLDFTLGSQGGVGAGTVESSRDEFSEQSVRRQTVELGNAQQNVNSLSALESQFDVSGNSGIPNALNNLLQSFSAWGQQPSDTTSRQTVIDRATSVATAFQQAAAGLANAAQDTEGQLQQTVSQVNGLAAKLQGLNSKILHGSRNDAGIDAQVNATLEQLSQFVDVTATHQADGTVTVLANGETPLVVGDKAYALSYGLEAPAATATYPDGAPSAHIFQADGRDITTKVTGGQLGALLNVHNKVLPSYMGDAEHAGDLNTMAEQFATRVNQLLTSGQVSGGATPVAGAALFQFDSVNHTRVAQSLTVDPAVTPDQLGAIDPGPPQVSNGIPLALANLANSTNAADKVNGVSYSSFYGQMAGRVGSALSDAKDQLQGQQSAVAQAKDLRQQISGVSLNEEATVLIQFQRAYEANARLITVLDQLTQDTINILR